MVKRQATVGPVQLPTEAELEILNVLWSKGPSTVRDVHTAAGKATGYTTALKQLQVMAAKGLVKRNELYRSHVYEAAIPRERTQLRLTRNLLDRAFEGSAKGLVLGALSASKVTAAELAEIRTLIDEFEKGKR